MYYLMIAHLHKCEVMSLSVLIHFSLAFSESSRLKRNTSKPLTLGVYRFENNTKINYNIELDPKTTLFYDDAWRSHWCTYYNDREFFLTPRINEIEHLARSRKFNILHLNWKGDEENRDSDIRQKGRNLAKDGMLPIIQDSYPDNQKNNSKYIKGFADKCLYKEFNRKSPTRSQRPNPSISVANTDFVASNFKHVAAISRALGAKTVIIMGMHTNLCILSATLYLELANISIGYVDGLLDSGFYYNGQKKYIKTHSENNMKCNKWMASNHGWMIRDFDLLRALHSYSPNTNEPSFTLFSDQAHYFHRYYKKSYSFY